MNIGIHGKVFESDNRAFIKHVLETLNSWGAKIFISSAYCGILQKHDLMNESFISFEKEDDLGHLKLLMTLGGDGTLLEAVTQIGNSNVPILGINTGRLGFLATTAKDDIESALDCIKRDSYTFDERTLLHLDSDPNVFGSIPFALNDFTILKKDSSSMIVVNTYINGEFLNSYWADGIIVATPTGSTGYSISCGGPLILPQSNNFIITPVSPHNLTVRPMVVSDSAELTFTIEGRSKTFLISLDSRFETVDESIKLAVSRENFKIRLIKLSDSNYFKTLRQKLNWGLDARN
ncbi:MAG: NAD kinase [Bacteroidota bacterium]